MLRTRPYHGDHFLINCASIHYCLQRLTISQTVLKYSRPFEKSLQSHHLFHFTHGHTLHTDFGSNKMLLRLYDTRRAGTNLFPLHHGNRTYKHLPSKIWTTYLYSLIKHHDYWTQLRVQVLKLRNNENVLKIHNHVQGQCTQIHHQWTCLQDNKTGLKITDLQRVSTHCQLTWMLCTLPQHNESQAPGVLLVMSVVLQATIG